MNQAFVTYYNHLAKLSRVANKQTLFLAHILYRMHYKSDSGMLVATLTAHDKKQIMKDIGSTARNVLNTADQYISNLQKHGLLKSIGNGAYLIDPVSYGTAYVSSKVRMRAGQIYEQRVFKEDGTVGVESWIVTDDGEKIDLT